MNKNMYNYKRNILQASFQFCKNLALDQFQDIWEKILFPMKNVPEWVSIK